MESGLGLMEVEKSMQKNNVIQKKDFERYEIMIPFLNIAGRRRKEFLCSELEKMHPCFSNEFAYDSVIKKICKKGICEDVFVMNKYRLAEYERKRSFSGSGFFVEKDLEQGILPQRLFVDNKWRLTLYGIIACVLIGSLGVLFSALAAAKSSREMKGAGTVSLPAENLSADNAAAEGQELAGEDIDFYESSPVSKLLSIAQSSHGKICSLEWHLVNTGGLAFEQLNASVKGIYPENLTGYSSDSVLYEEGIPRSNISAKRKIISGLYEKGQNLSDSTGAGLSNADFNKALRYEITSHGGTLKEEKAPPYHIEFCCQNVPLSQTKEMLLKLGEIISAEERYITAVNIRQTGAYELRIGFSIEKEIPAGDFDLKAVSENLELFLESSDSASDKATAGKAGQFDGKGKIASTKKVSFQEAANDPFLDKSYVKIGEIKKSNNSLVLYYKSPDGKLKSIVKQN